MRIDDVGNTGHLVSVAFDEGGIEVVGLAAAWAKPSRAGDAPTWTTWLACS
ncbi:MAG: hypothetical protein H0T70_00295 [Acidimicrobiia bacterium]|nr:hypothetical protein [Acidimicrobiia bacterium]